MVKLLWHKAASPQQRTSSIVFARWRQCALPWGHLGATRRIRLNLCFLGPTQVHNLNCKSIGSAVFAQLMVESPYILAWTPLFPIIALPMGIWTPSNLWFLGPVRTDNTNSITIGSAVFAQMTAKCPYALQWAPFSPSPQNCRFPWRACGPPWEAYRGRPRPRPHCIRWGVGPSSSPKRGTAAPCGQIVAHLSYCVSAQQISVM